MQNPSTTQNVSWLAAIVMLFGLLAFASHSNELLKQVVIGPGSSAEMGFAADCRADELEEEQLSLEECQLMVSNVRIILSSSPAWFRSIQIALSLCGVAAAVASMVAVFSLARRRSPQLRLARLSIGLLLLVDVVGFLLALNLGPLLRAQYLFPLLLWAAIHLCLLMALIRSPLKEAGVS